MKKNIGPCFKGFIIIEFIVLTALLAAGVYQLFGPSKAHGEELGSTAYFCEVADYIQPQSADTVATKRRLNEFNSRIDMLCPGRVKSNWQLYRNTQPALVKGKNGEMHK